MNKLKFTALLLGYICVMSFTACNKEEKVEPIVGTWQTTKVEESTNGGSWSDKTKSCELDDVEEYATGGKWTMYDGPNQCNAGTGMITGTWRLSAGGSKIVYTYTNYSGEYESSIELLEGNKMVITHAVGDIHNTQMRRTYTKK